MSQPKPVSPIVFKPKNAAQKQFVALWPHSKIMFALGPAGTGKTHVALAKALIEKCSPLWLCRPSVPCDEELGFVPGDLDDKLKPWLAPFSDVLVGMSTETNIAKFKAEAVSAGMLRGRTVRGCLICEEAQNLSRAQLLCILTRLGDGGKIVLCGDPDQSDLRDSPLEEVASSLDDMPEVAIVRFTQDQCIRDPLITKILDRLK